MSWLRFSSQWSLRRVTKVIPWLQCRMRLSMVLLCQVFSCLVGFSQMLHPATNPYWFGRNAEDLSTEVIGFTLRNEKGEVIPLYDTETPVVLTFPHPTLPSQTFCFTKIRNDASKMTVKHYILEPLSIHCHFIISPFHKWFGGVWIK